MQRYLNVLLLLFCFSLPQVFAADVQQPIDFAVPAQNLQDALEQYSVITGRELLYGSNVVDGKRSAALMGRWPPDEALLILLRGSGVQARYAGKNAFTLLKANPVSLIAPVPSGTDGAPSIVLKKQYYRRFQTRFTRLLCQDDVLKKNVSRAVLQFWFSRDGGIERLRLLDPAGNDSFGQRLVSRARQLNLNSTLPDSVHQPLTVVIDPRIPLVCNNSE